MATLPQDLIERVLGLADTSVLFTCSVVGRTPFCEASQRRLFRSMRLHRLAPNPLQHRARPLPVHFSPNLGDLRAFLAASPHISGFIRHVTTPIPFGAHEQLTLESILRLLPNINHLAIKHQYLTMSAGLINVLQNDILPILQRLDLVSLYLPPSFLLRAAGVPTLHMSNVSLHGIGEQTGAPSSLECLRHLAVTAFAQDSSSYEVLLNNPRFASHLERLNILTYSSPDCTPHLSRLLIAAAPSLRHLGLDSVPPSVSLPRMPLVHTVELDLRVSQNGEFISALAETAASLPQVQTLNLHCEVYSIAVTSFPWTSIEHRQNVHFAHLRRIDCQLSVVVGIRKMGTTNLDPFLQYFRTIMEGVMPVLQGNDMLRCALSDSAYRAPGGADWL